MPGGTGLRPPPLCTSAAWVFCVALLAGDIAAVTSGSSRRHLLQSPGSCALGKQLCGGKCVSTSSNPAACGSNCTRCRAPTPAGSGSAVCINGTCSVFCKQGYERRGSRSICRVCGKGFFKPEAGQRPCSRCPDGTTTTGSTAADHDELRDCLPGGLIPSLRQTGSSLEKLQEFEDEWIRALNNTGGRGKPKGSGGNKGGNRKTKACLYDCDGFEWTDETERASMHVAHLAGSPLTYSSNNPADVFAGVNLVGAVRNQGQCATCVSHAVVSAATSAVAAALAIDARQINMSHVFAYYCGPVLDSAVSYKSCRSGWGLDEALKLASTRPEAFFVNESCLDGIDIQKAALANGALVQPYCLDAASRCPTTAFKCGRVLLSDSIVEVQRAIRRQGAVMTRILVDSAFRSFFQRNPTGVFNGSAAGIDWNDVIFHAVLLVGYDNEEFYWTALNSWGESWGDKGLFRIAYGVADVGHPEDTYSLTNCFTTSSDPPTVAGWSRPRPVWLDPAAEGCYLYTAVAKDSISGIADHFVVDILQLVKDNVARGVIPLKSPDTGSQEPQLQPPSGSWAGTVFRVCGIPKFIFNRVATVTAPPSPPRPPPPPLPPSQVRQLQALLSIKADLVSPTSRALQDWSRASDGGYCSWEGITCDYMKNVTAIEISNVDLGGTLSDSGSWPLLSGLQQIKLIGCRLSGTIPSSWASMARLERLEVSRNQLSSSLPEQLPPGLRHLDVADNGLTGSLAPVFQPSSLSYIKLCPNRFDPGPLPDAGVLWPLMQDLNLQECGFTGTIPDSYSRMTNLTRLVLSGNRLEGTLPASIATLSKLRSFNASNCDLSGTIPAEYGDGFASLLWFDVSGNPNMEGCNPIKYLLVKELYPGMRSVVEHRMLRFEGTRITRFCAGPPLPGVFNRSPPPPQ